MLIDRKSLEVVRVASTEPSRFAINGVQIEPDGTAVATNGKSLMVVQGTAADPAEYPEQAGEQVEIKEGGLILDADHIKQIVKIIPRKKNTLDILKHVALVKGNNGHVTFASWDGIAQQCAAHALEGTFPRYREVIPPLNKKDKTICLSVSSLRKILEAAGRMMDDEHDAVEISFSTSSKPAVLRFKLDRDRRALAVTMPMSVKDEDYYAISDWEEKIAGWKKKKEEEKKEKKGK